MATKSKRVTTCTVCKRQVGVAVNWQRQQAGRLVDEFRATRHAVAEERTYERGSYVRRPICPGSGILVAAEAVTERQPVNA